MYTVVYLQQRDCNCFKKQNKKPEHVGSCPNAKVNLVPQASMTFIYANRGLWEQDWVDHNA